MFKRKFVNYYIIIKLQCNLKEEKTLDKKDYEGLMVIKKTNAINF